MLLNYFAVLIYIENIPAAAVSSSSEVSVAFSLGGRFRRLERTFAIRMDNDAAIGSKCGIRPGKLWPLVPLAVQDIVRDLCRRRCKFEVGHGVR